MSDDTLEAFVERALTRCGLSASQLTTELRRAGLLPEYWTVIDVADYLKENYGPAPEKV